MTTILVCWGGEEKMAPDGLLHGRSPRECDPRQIWYKTERLTEVMDWLDASGKGSVLLAVDDTGMLWSQRR